MKLGDLAAELPEAEPLGAAEATITAVCSDSRRVIPGALFAAVPGFQHDGHDYIRSALAAGAAALLVQSDREHKWRSVLAEAEVAALVVADTRIAVAAAAAAFYGHPGRRLRVIGVTGTDGKTSLAHLIAHVLETAGGKSGLLSTAENRAGDRPLADTGRFTTPEATEVQEMLSQMGAAGCRYAVIEATSHGLALHRLDGCEFDLAVMTNVGLDHIDFHGTVEEYRAAKGHLFAMLDGAADKRVLKTAVLNADDPAHQYFRSLTRARAVTYALASGADVSLESAEPDGWGTRVAMRTPLGPLAARIGRPGPFNVANALAASAVGLALAMDPAKLVRGLESWPGAPGRMELVDEGQPFRVVVDFAHAPESLRRVLSDLRQSSRGRLIAVFGCIGERDRERRLPMGQAAAELADYTIVTDDNPYSEDRGRIIGEIAAGLRGAGKREGHDFALVPDRREAIAQALAMAVDEDTVLLAGKGHEIRVYLGDGFYDCDDRAVARRVLRELVAGR